MQFISDIGDPLGIIRALADYINNQNNQADWLVAVNPITSSKDFWSIVGQYKGRISEMDMTFVTPNMWGGSTATENALREIHNVNHGQTVEVRIKDPDRNLQPDSERIRQSVEYIAEGGGSIKLKDGQETLYSSDETVVKQSGGEDDVSVQDAAYELVIALVRKLFGR